MITQEIKEKIVAISKKCFEEKLFAGTSGNLSIYDAETGHMYITPGSYPYELLLPKDIVVLTLGGKPIESPHKPSSEWQMHAEVYKKMPEVGAVIHTHSPYATSFAVNNTTIPAILIEMIPFLGGNVPLAEFAIPGTPQIGEYAVAVLQKRNACLLANHGVLCIGATLDQAYIRAVYTEDAAKIYAIARSNNTKIIEIDPTDIAFMQNRSKAAKSAKS